jgi:hypothetical protein
MRTTVARRGLLQLAAAAAFPSAAASSSSALLARVALAASPHRSLLSFALSRRPLLPSVTRAPSQCRGMFIQTQATPNAHALKFLPGREVAGAGGSHDFSSFRAASAASPLAALLFGIPGVQGVYLGPDFVSVNVAEGSDWALIKPEIFAAIMDFYASGKPVVYDKPTGEGAGEGEETRSSTTILPTDSEVVGQCRAITSQHSREHKQTTQSRRTVRRMNACSHAAAFLCVLSLLLSAMIKELIETVRLAHSPHCGHPRVWPMGWDARRVCVLHLLKLMLTVTVFVCPPVPFLSSLFLVFSAFVLRSKRMAETSISVPLMSRRAWCVYKCRVPAKDVLHPLSL